MSEQDGVIFIHTEIV